MTIAYHKQAYLHRPPEQFGDCHRTCVACLLNVPREDVPHTHKLEPENLWENLIQDYLATLGLKMISLPLTISWEEILAYNFFFNSGIYYILSGITAKGTPHSVVCGDGQILHDPSLEPSPIIAPMPNGSYRVWFLVPLS